MSVTTRLLLHSSFTRILKSKNYHVVFISEETEAQSKSFDNLVEISGLITDGIGIKKPILFPYAYIMCAH